MKCKCVDCGYLSLASNDSQGTLKEASVEYRNWNPGYGSQPMAYCFRLADRLGWNGGVEISPKETFEKVKAERDCPAFYPWTQGFSPKEHRAMEMHYLEEQARRLWEEKQAMVAEERHRETISVAIEAAKKSSSSALWGAVVGALVAGLFVLLGIAISEYINKT